MRRREFITLLGGGAAAWPMAARAQEVAPRARSTDRLARIAFVSFLGAAGWQPYGRAFRDGLRLLGWIEGRNVAIEERFAEGEDERLPAIVDEILAMKPEVIVIDGARVVRAFRERTVTTPIVTAVVSAATATRKRALEPSFHHQGQKRRHRCMTGRRRRSAFRAG